MKCAFCVSACAVLIVAASIVPVRAGELDPSPPHVQTARQFNDLLNSGEFEQAEAFAKEAFLRNSSDPVAVLMLRQILSNPKGQIPQIVFPAHRTKSRVINPSAGNYCDESCRVQSFPMAGKSKSFAMVKIEPKRLGQTISGATAPIDVKNPIASSTLKSCVGGCLDPLSGIVTIPGQAQGLLVVGSGSETALDASGIQHAFGIEKDMLSPLTPRVAQSGFLEEAEVESTISFQLIKGQVATLERLGIAIQSETARQISVPKLNAAKDALPTPITVPVVTPANDVVTDRVTSPLVPLTAAVATAPEAELPTGICTARNKIVRSVNLPLATRRLSSEERQEMLKAAQAAPRVNLVNLPRVSLLNGQSFDLANSIVDSAGKNLGLQIKSEISSDRRTVTLRLSFHSEQGPAALSQTIVMNELLESDQALLIALDDSRTGVDADASANRDRMLTYLVVSPQLPKHNPAKVAFDGKSSLDFPYPLQRIRKVASVQTETNAKSAPQQDLYETRVYAVADLVIPVSRSVDIFLDSKQGPQAPLDVAPKADFSQLIHTITDCIAPNEWDEVGGSGSIRPFESTLSLVVRQTPPIQAQIGDLIEKLRKEQDVQASVEFKLISGDPDSLAKAGFGGGAQSAMLSQAELDSRVAKPALKAEVGSPCNLVPEMTCPLAACLNFVLQDKQSTHPAFAVLDALSVGSCLADCCRDATCCSDSDGLSALLLTQAQREFLLANATSLKECNVLAMPKVTLFNGQTVNLHCGDGLTLCCRIEVQPDLKSMITLVQISKTECDGTKPISCSAQTFKGNLINGESIAFTLPKELGAQDSDSKTKSAATIWHLLVTPKTLVLPGEQEVQLSNPKPPRAANSVR